MSVSKFESTFFAGYWGFFKPCYAQRIVQDFANVSNDNWFFVSDPVTYPDVKKVSKDMSDKLGYAEEMLKGEMSEENREFIEFYRDSLTSQYLDFRKDSLYVLNI